MNRRFWIVAMVILVALPIALTGCKAKAEKPAETPEAMMIQEETIGTQTVEPAQKVMTETIPPTTAAPMQAVERPQLPAHQEALSRNKDIQAALKSAGLYAGAIDGKIGPKTKKAIEEFQMSKGLKADGKVGPKTWAELEKYLVQQ